MSAASRALLSVLMNMHQRCHTSNGLAAVLLQVPSFLRPRHHKHLQEDCGGPFHVPHLLPNRCSRPGAQAATGIACLTVVCTTLQEMQGSCPSSVQQTLQHKGASALEPPVPLCCKADMQLHAVYAAYLNTGSTIQAHASWMSLLHGLSRHISCMP